MRSCCSERGQSTRLNLGDTPAVEAGSQRTDCLGGLCSALAKAFRFEKKEQDKSWPVNLPRTRSLCGLATWKTKGFTVPINLLASLRHAFGIRTSGQSRLAFGGNHRAGPAITACQGLRDGSAVSRQSGQQRKLLRCSLCPATSVSAPENLWSEKPWLFWETGTAIKDLERFPQGEP